MLKPFATRQKPTNPWFLPSLFVLATFSQQALAEFKPVTTTSQLAVQVFFGLLLVLALIFSLAWLAKKMRFMPAGMHNPDVMRPLASMHLGPKEKLVLIEIGKQQLLLGVTSQQVNLIHQLAEPINLAEETQKTAKFAQIFSQWLTKEPKAGNSETKN